MKIADELIDIIKSNYLEKVFFNLDDISEYLVNDDDEYIFETDDECYEYLSKLGLENFEQLEYVSNTDEMYCIIHFKNENIYLKLIGKYDSYGQYKHDYECGIKEVFPKQVLETKYVTNE